MFSFRAIEGRKRSKVRSKRRRAPSKLARDSQISQSSHRPASVLTGWRRANRWPHRESVRVAPARQHSSETSRRRVPRQALRGPLQRVSLTCAGQRSEPSSCVLVIVPLAIPAQNFLAFLSTCPARCRWRPESRALAAAAPVPHTSNSSVNRAHPCTSYIRWRGLGRPASRRRPYVHVHEQRPATATWL